MEINAELIAGMKMFLDDDGIKFFRECVLAHGSITPVLVEQTETQTIYHPVHFNQGHQIRKFMKASGLCDNWTETEIFQHWTMVVDMAIA